MIVCIKMPINQNSNKNDKNFTFITHILDRIRIRDMHRKFVAIPPLELVYT